MVGVLYDLETLLEGFAIGCKRWIHKLTELVRLGNSTGWKFGDHEMIERFGMD